MSRFKFLSSSLYIVVSYLLLDTDLFKSFDLEELLYYTIQYIVIYFFQFQPFIINFFIKKLFHIIDLFCTENINQPFYQRHVSQIQITNNKTNHKIHFTIFPSVNTAIDNNLKRHN